MSVARTVRFTARAGEGDALVAALVAAAATLRGVAGCEEWVVHRVAGVPEAVVVTERWRSDEDATAALETPDSRDGVAAVLATLDPELPPQRTDLEPVDGVGLLPPPEGGVTQLALRDAEDKAPSFGIVGTQSRFPTAALGLQRTGVAHFVMAPGARLPFGHQHANAEELYVVMAGSGELWADGDVRPVRAGEAVRVGPGVTRGWRAGGDGLEVLAVGPRHPGDGQTTPDPWA